MNTDIDSPTSLKHMYGEWNKCSSSLWGPSWDRFVEHRRSGATLAQHVLKLNVHMEHWTMATRNHTASLYNWFSNTEISSTWHCSSGLIQILVLPLNMTEYQQQFCHERWTLREELDVLNFRRYHPSNFLRVCCMYLPVLIALCPVYARSLQRIVDTWKFRSGDTGIAILHCVCCVP